MLKAPREIKMFKSKMFDLKTDLPYFNTCKV